MITFHWHVHGLSTIPLRSRFSLLLPIIPVIRYMVKVPEPNVLQIEKLEHWPWPTLRKPVMWMILRKSLWWKLNKNGVFYTWDNNMSNIVLPYSETTVLHSWLITPVAPIAWLICVMTAYKENKYWLS